MSAEVIHRTEDVYGISREVPLNYTERVSADIKLIDSLPRGKHLVIYGSSKQGKTCLRKHCLQPADYIVVHCSNKWGVGDINSAILKQVGYEVTQSSSKATSGNSKVTAKLGVNWFGNKAEGGMQSERSIGNTVEKAPLELDPLDVNDIIRALEEIGFKKFIVLEDFHYLDLNTQRDFSVALKAYHENSNLCFIIVGVWLEENRLTVYNGDLTGRVLAIDADLWTHEELRQVIKAGEALLNVTLAPKFVEDLIASCFSSVYLVQEACLKVCLRNNVFETVPTHREVAADIDAASIIKEVINGQSGRFKSFLTQFASGFEATTLNMYRWLLYPVITSNVTVLEDGLKFQDIRKKITAKHPKGGDLNPGNIRNALNYAAQLQVSKNVKPLILDFDETNSELRVVDKGFLIWLSMQECNELLDLVELPV